MELFERIDEKSIILTPNHRLCASLTQHYQKMQSNKNSSWASATILPWKTWQDQLWIALLPQVPVNLLSSTEELIVWQNIIAADNNSLLNPSATAKLAQNAFQILAQWQVDPNSLENNTENTQQFHSWVKAYLNFCKTRNYISSSEACNTLITHCEQITAQLPKEITLYAFLELTPQQQSLCDALQGCGITIHHQEPDYQNISSYKTQAQTPEHELQNIVSWAKKQYEESDQTTIACVFPNLNLDRDKIEREFKLIFKTDTPPIDFSAGKKLSGYPIIDIVFDLINFNHSSFPYQHISKVLLSPFIISAENELTNRHQIDKALRKFINTETNTAEIMRLLSLDSIAEKYNTGELISCLKQFSDQSHQTKKSLPSHHSQTLLTQLTTMGWPGQRTLNSMEYQLVNRVISLLKEATQLDQLLGSISYKQFVKLFKQMLSNTVFQGESEKTRIQILGSLEASGLEFDRMWVANMDDLTWPSKPSPNPFLPIELQIEKNMPHCSADRELRFCKILTMQLTKYNQNIIFSYAEKNADKTLRPSPLINHLPNKVVNSVTNDFTQPSTLEELIDEQGPALDTKTENKGGTDILRRQALCPFQAFGYLRLHADTVDEPSDGLDHLDRGTIMHKALELMWRELHSQAKLNSLLDHELQKIIDQSVSQALTSYNQNDKIIQLEKIRLHDLLLKWCEVEKTRDAFEVAAMESRRHYQLAGMTLKMTVDRIDTLANGEQAIIDYKTGLTTINNWFSERPKEPQLPLYCISNEKEVDSLLFAQVRQNEMCFKGISQDDYDADQSWLEQKQAWQKDLTKLMQEYIAGEAQVDPVDYTACQYCELQSLCRIHSYAE